jgi:hypothetical protein
MSIHQRYNSEAAHLYRSKISALAEGCEWSREESLKKIGKITNHSISLSHSKSASALSNNSYQDGTSFDHSSTYQSREFKDQRDNFFNNLQAANSQRPDGLKPSEGGRYAGFNKAAFIYSTNNLFSFQVSEIQCSCHRAHNLTWLSTQQCLHFLLDGTYCHLVPIK